MQGQPTRQRARIPKKEAAVVAAEKVELDVKLPPRPKSIVLIHQEKVATDIGVIKQTLLDSKHGLPTGKKYWLGLTLDDAFSGEYSEISDLTKQDMSLWLG